MCEVDVIALFCAFKPFSCRLTELLFMETDLCMFMYLGIFIWNEQQGLRAPDSKQRQSGYLTLDLSITVKLLKIIAITC